MDKQMLAFDHYDRGLVLKRVQMFAQAIEDFKKAALDPLNMPEKRMCRSPCA